MKSSQSYRSLSLSHALLMHLARKATSTDDENPFYCFFRAILFRARFPSPLRTGIFPLRARRIRRP